MFIYLWTLRTRRRKDRLWKCLNFEINFFWIEHDDCYLFVRMLIMFCQVMCKLPTVLMMTSPEDSIMKKRKQQEIFFSLKFNKPTHLIFSLSLSTNFDEEKNPNYFSWIISCQIVKTRRREKNILLIINVDFYLLWINPLI